MTHPEMDELYDLYVLGVLEPELAAQIDEHVARQCSYCLEHIREASQFTAALAGIADEKPAPASLRARVLATTIRSPRARNSVPWIVGFAAACLALLAFSLWSRNEMSHLRQQLSVVISERDQLREALEVMSRPNTRTIQFGRAENVPHGRVFFNRERGLVFVGFQLPQLASDRTFQLWLVPPQGAPRSAGLFRPNAQGQSVTMSSTVVNPAQTKAVAVSIEPREGSPAPTTTPILVVPLE